jgi:hypothetical protein
VPSTLKKVRFGKSAQLVRVGRGNFPQPVLDSRLMQAVTVSATIAAS